MSCHMLCPSLIKARWGKNGGLGGKGNPSASAGGVSLPPKIYI